jgi:D-alanyl-lipoteichoic acid acyltransferase DltB (MBOAT superfamily)
VTVPSVSFLAFAAVAALIFNLGKAAWWRQVVLLATNVAFFASFSPNPLSYVPFLAFLALGFLTQIVTGNGARPRFFVFLLVLTIAVFVWLKRYSFVPNAAFLPFLYVLVGLSYVFFRVVHLIIDRHQGEIEGRVGLVSYLNYTLNFTALTSGPIQRYDDYRRMELERLPLDLVVAGRALERIIIGYFKVAIVSMLLAEVQHEAIDALLLVPPLADRVATGILVAALYPLYLYANFSGYVDVVIGVARFFRIELPENFDRPFSSENFINFWSRWHITLSSWLKTYVYNPLMMVGMERIAAPALAPYIGVFAFFVTFFLVGLWHGQTSEFLFFGFLQGGGVAANKLYQLLMQKRLGHKGYRELARNPVYTAICRGLTFTWFAFTLLWFWSNWQQIATFSHALGPEGMLLTWLAIFIVATVLLAIGEPLRRGVLRMSWQGGPLLLSRYVRTAWGTALAAVTVAVIVLLNSPAPDIVYKSF